ncbi:MAG: dihydropteroate synthase [Thermodesulfobacteriota bacterium]|nr:dihydropteroate synthase [Thermodesulfobacteriota bacterium]
MMIFIGESINGLNSRIYKTILEKNKETIQILARRQVEAGAGYLDLNVGTAWLRPAEVMVWLVETVQEVTDTPLAIDSRRLDVVEAGLQVCKKPAMINYTTGEKEKLAKFMELAIKYQTAIVALTMDEQGIPPHAVGRVAIAKRIMDFAEGYGLPRDRLFIDPVLLPLKFSHSQGPIIIESIRQIARERVSPHIVVGLSNCSQGTKQRRLINRTFLAMAMACGLDAVIADVLDHHLVETGMAAEVILERHPAADQFFRGVKKPPAQAG